MFYFSPASIIGLRLTQLIKIQIGEMDRDSFDNEASKQNGLKRIIWESFRCILWKGCCKLRNKWRKYVIIFVL